MKFVDQRNLCLCKSTMTPNVWEFLHGDNSSDDGEIKIRYTAVVKYWRIRSYLEDIGIHCSARHTRSPPTC